MQNRQPHFAAATPVAPPITVIGPTYCAPHPIELEIVRTLNSLTAEFSVKDIKGNTVFNLEKASCSLHKRCILHDPAGNPILTVRRKIITGHNRWQIFRGKSERTDDLLFSVKRPDFIKRKTKLDVFIAENTEEVCAFKVEGNWSNGCCDVYAFQSDNIVAKMLKYVDQDTKSDNVVVRVETNVDSAFIVALIVILSLE